MNLNVNDNDFLLLIMNVFNFGYDFNFIFEHVCVYGITYSSRTCDLRCSGIPLSDILLYRFCGRLLHTAICYPTLAFWGFAVPLSRISYYVINNIFHLPVYC